MMQELNAVFRQLREMSCKPVEQVANKLRGGARLVLFLEMRGHPTEGYSENLNDVTNKLQLVSASIYCKP